ncbi:hypothetical protein NIES267_47960 [Calothrix parasitica NIES-267]|uniref:Uncharacterized protein n=1 Tax=Calothrix parasitica NIES-267 TaxID=1973488 RepID=A0A1Z4LVM5_9CYAN|nr:hypothetical protein NIES267_47960 [Calothrix parasitica NIES-267]
MNTFNFSSDIESLISRLKQLEAENSLWKENTLILQRSLDELRRDFRDREELQQVQTMQQTILQLSAQVAELQQSLSQLSVGDNGFIYPVNNQIINQEEDLDDDEMVSHLLDLMEEDPEEIEEIEENIQVISEAEKEFKAERILFLLDRIYSVEETISAEELLPRY